MGWVREHYDNSPKAALNKLKTEFKRSVQITIEEMNQFYLGPDEATLIETGRQILVQWQGVHFKIDLFDDGIKTPNGTFPIRETKEESGYDAKLYYPNTENVLSPEQLAELLFSEFFGSRLAEPKAPGAS